MMKLVLLQLICIILLHKVNQYECTISNTKEVIYFKPNTEYVFQLETNANLKSARLESTLKVMNRSFEYSQ